MGVRAIFANSGIPFWIDVAAYLRDKYSWEILYFIGADSGKSFALSKFPGAVFHKNREAKKNIAPRECADIPRPPLDKDLISALSGHESVILKILNRHDMDGSFSYHKRVFFYHTQIMYWMGVIAYYKPNVVVFRTAPHMGFDYALYAVCDVLGVKTIMFEKTAILGRIIPEASFVKGYEALNQTYKKKIAEYESNPFYEIEMADDLTQHLINLRKTYDKAMPFALKYKLEHHKNEGQVGPMGILLSGVKDLIKGLLIRNRDPDFLKNKFYLNLGTYKRWRLANYYDALSKDVDLEVPYVFAALQCEPERQTVPCGGVFGNQYLMIDSLSKTIPDGWKVYVKEHVSQFKSFQKAERGRSKDFYNYIDSLPNVDFVPLSYTSFDLIDKAMASATVSGSVGWESVARGKPALLFGYAWYRDCEGIFLTHTSSQLREALKKISEGFQVSKKRVQLFTSAIGDVSFKGSIDPLFDKADILPYEQNVINFGKSIHQFYQNDERYKFKEEGFRDESGTNSRKVKFRKNGQRHTQVHSE